MKFWTHHPTCFRLDETDVRVDFKSGSNWNSTEAGFRYREILPLLHQRLGTDQLLWSCTVRGLYCHTSEPSDLIEWQIDVPLSSVTLFRASVWNDLIRGRTNCWDPLFIKIVTDSAAMSEDIDALIRLPLPVNCLTCHGLLPSKYLKGSKKNPAHKEYQCRIGRRAA